ncbi:hypothetical protein QAD02_005007 [Eretmocerus hayati]|uniref:Uncharacterized protein n=1 Tax=Eretmocerus hayati TaxID=131215 RepID=A0ACC2NRB1_9HYME|nr:hypothetical protein QAD02_005007 [Eretmocerus hayati]
MKNCFIKARFPTGNVVPVENNPKDTVMDDGDIILHSLDLLVAECGRSGNQHGIKFSSMDIRDLAEIRQKYDLQELQNGEKLYEELSSRLKTLKNHISTQKILSAK